MVREKTKGGVTPLMKAAEASSLDVTAYLLSLGADPCAVDNNNRTALDYAASADKCSQVYQTLKEAQQNMEN